MQNSNTNAKRIYASMPHLHPKDYAGRSPKQSCRKVFPENHSSVGIVEKEALERGD
jgi:hypothetical protein